ISGPLLDRIDLQVEVPEVSVDALAGAPDGEPSRVVPARVRVARALASTRQGCPNAQLHGDALDRHPALSAGAAKFLQAAAARLGWAAPRFHPRPARAHPVPEDGG